MRVCREETVQERAKPEGGGNLEQTRTTEKEPDRNAHLFLKGFDRAAFSFDTPARVHDSGERKAG